MQQLVIGTIAALLIVDVRQPVRLLHDVAAASEVVGLAIAEYMPWEAITMQNLLRRLPLIASQQ